MPSHYTLIEEAAARREARRTNEIVAKLAQQIGDLTRDRDEWKAQHENLLAMYRASQERVAYLEAKDRQAYEDGDLCDS